MTTARGVGRFPVLFGELGSDGAATAARELHEELDVSSVELKFLGKLLEDEIYLARLDGDARASLDKRGDVAVDLDEGINGLRLVTVSGLCDMMLSGEIVDSYTLAVFAFAIVRDMLTIGRTRQPYQD